MASTYTRRTIDTAHSPRSFRGLPAPRFLEIPSLQSSIQGDHLILQLLHSRKCEPRFPVLKPSTKPFPFLDLPRELRDQIYEEIVIIDPWQTRVKGSWGNCLNLTQVNRQLRRETLLTLHHRNKWIVLITDKVADASTDSRIQASSLKNFRKGRILHWPRAYTPFCCIDAANELLRGTNCYLLSIHSLPRLIRESNNSFKTRCISIRLSFAPKVAEFEIAEVRNMLLSIISSKVNILVFGSLKNSSWSQTRWTNFDANDLNALFFRMERNINSAKKRDDLSLARCYILDRYRSLRALDLLSFNSLVDFGADWARRLQKMIFQQGFSLARDCVPCGEYHVAIRILMSFSRCEICDTGFRHRLSLSDEWYAKFQYTLGTVYEKMGETCLAIYMFFAALNKNPGFREVEAVLDRLEHELDDQDTKKWLRDVRRWNAQKGVGVGVATKDAVIWSSLTNSLAFAKDWRGNLPCHHWNERNMIYVIPVEY